MGAIVFVTTAWGPRHGGINSFNADLCEAVAALPGHDLRVMCLVVEATHEDVMEAAARGIELLAAGGDPGAGVVDEARSGALVDVVRNRGEVLWWVGHDVISGPAAVAAARTMQVPAAVIQHTDYRSYGAIKGSSGEKILARHLGEVDTLLNTDVVFGVGPRLAAAAHDRVRERGDEADAVELVPGLAPVQPLATLPSTFRAITVGRLDPVNDRLKQARLAVHAFGRLIGEVGDHVGPDPGMTVLGIERGAGEEAELRETAARHAGRFVSVIGHPFTESRNVLYRVLRDSSACMMLSIHEGFGLTGWEAIAAEVPLVVSQNSGLHDLLARVGGQALGCVEAVDVKGHGDPPYYLDADVVAVTAALRRINLDREAAKRNARALKLLLGEYTWERTARDLLGGLRLAARGPGVAAVAPAAEPGALPGSNLPTLADSFVGRSQELDDCRGLVLGGARLVTLVGPAGAGKTRFAQELARTLLEVFDDHVYFVDLTNEDDPTLLVASITRALSIEAGEPVIDALKELFRDKRVLLLLDTFEEVLEAAPTVRELIEALPGLHVVATSREPMRITGEQRLGLEPLEASDAMRLFAERADGLSPDEPGLRALCAFLDGLPLAIELVAPLTSVSSPAELLPMLERSLLDVKAHRQDVPAKHRSLRATIETSYSRLTPAQQRLFRRLSVFAGGSTLHTAATILRGGPPDLAFGEEMRSLVDKRLLRDAPERPRRFGMLETLRQFAIERLEEDPAEAAWARREHADFFLRLGEAMHPDRAVVGQAAALEAIEGEHDNLTAALAHFVREQETDAAVRLALALGRFWWSRDYAAGWERVGQVLRLPDGRPERRARLLAIAGRLAIRLGRLDDAAAAFDEGLDIARRQADARLEAEALGNMALVPMERAEFEAARPLLDRALAIWKEQNDEPGMADVLDSLGVSATGLGEHATARDRLEESLMLYRRGNDDAGEAWVRNDLARLALAVGDLQGAREHAEAALAVGLGQTEWALIAWARNYLGLAAARQGRYDEARDHHAESLKLVILLGDTRPTALALEGFAALAAEQDQWDRALRLSGAAEAQRLRKGIERTKADWAMLDALDRATAALSKSEIAAAESAGRAMTLEQAAAFARGE